MEKRLCKWLMNIFEFLLVRSVTVSQILTTDLNVAPILGLYYFEQVKQESRFRMNCIFQLSSSTLPWLVREKSCVRNHIWSFTKPTPNQDLLCNQREARRNWRHRSVTRKNLRVLRQFPEILHDTIEIRQWRQKSITESFPNIVVT